jgi:hypothetical protein
MGNAKRFDLCSTRSNRITAERMDEEIKQMESALAGILNPNGKTES